MNEVFIVFQYFKLNMLRFQERMDVSNSEQKLEGFKDSRK